MACKTQCESVVEGMGSTWDKCATDARHPTFEQGAEEGVIAWSAPQPFHPEAVPFVNAALRHHFGGGPDKWNFTHSDQRASRLHSWLGGSQVIERHLKVPPRLPKGFYNGP